MLRLGLCCGFVGEQSIRFRTTTVRYSSSLPPTERQRFVHELAAHNVAALRGSIAWCASHGVGAFRVPSGLLPMYTHPAIGWRLDESARGEEIARGLRGVGEEARRRGVRLSLHPDQFVVLGSVNESSVVLAVRELEYQAECAALLGAEQLTVHGGGATGGKTEALERFRRNLDRLSARARRLVALENDDRVYTVVDLLPVCRAEGIPLVYDVHHHRCNPDGLSAGEATHQARETWRGREPWLHLSSPASGWSSTKDIRTHADYITPSDVPREWLTLAATVDIEAKQKELAVLRLRRWMLARLGDAAKAAAAAAAGSAARPLTPPMPAPRPSPRTSARSGTGSGAGR
jgi:UV DNA damage endonuclease